jgi:butyryl-CoA dehydrogenase
MFLLGDDAVKEKYLRDIVAGRRACNIALTEPNAGSALTHLTTTEVRDGDAYLLNGTKSFLTGSNVNDLNATFVRFDGVPGAKGIGAVVVETSMPGVEIKRGPVYIGDRGIHHGDMVLTDVRVPAENLIVGPGQFARLMTAFNLERLHNCGFWLGFSQAALDDTIAYVKERKQFGKAIGTFQALRHRIADLATELECARLLTYEVAARLERGADPVTTRMTSMAKIKASQIAKTIALEGMQMMGGYGYATEYDMESHVRHSLVLPIYAGTNEIQREIISGSLGLR